MEREGALRCDHLGGRRVRFRRSGAKTHAVALTVSGPGHVLLARRHLRKNAKTCARLGPALMPRATDGAPLWWGEVHGSKTSGTDGGGVGPGGGRSGCVCVAGRSSRDGGQGTRRPPALTRASGENPCLMPLCHQGAQHAQGAPKFGQLLIRLLQAGHSPLHALCQPELA